MLGTPFISTRLPPLQLTLVSARVDPLRYQRQIAMFHDIIGFTKLGMAFEDTIEGRSYAAITDVETMAAERGFEIEKELHLGYVPPGTPPTVIGALDRDSDNQVTSLEQPLNSAIAEPIKWIPPMRWRLFEK